MSGDNASIDRVRDIAERLGPFDLALLSAGGAQSPLVEGGRLTLTSEEAAEAAAMLGARHVVPLHVAGWAHLTQGADTLRERSRAGASGRMHLLEPGERLELVLEDST